MKLKIKNILNKKSIFNLSDSFHKSMEITSFPKKNKNTPPSWIKINYKTYPRLKRILLPKPAKTKNNIFKLLISRRSVRDFSDKTISLVKLSTILYYSAGITYIENNNWDVALRSYPSGGARYPLELYVLVNNVKKLKEGIYHYNVKDNYLETLIETDCHKIIENITTQNITKEANVVIIISAVFDRTRIKYGDRGYRFSFIESGHLAQNLYLVSEALSLGCCTIGGFIDDKINCLLDLNDTCEKVIYLAAIGSKK